MATLNTDSLNHPNRANNVPDHIIKILIKTGDCLENNNNTEHLEPIRKYSWINTRGHKEWELIAQLLSFNDLTSLIKCITLAESQFKWIGGSVAAVIWNYRIFQKRFPDHADQLADWILRNSTNTYLPFGHDNFGATSLKDYKRIKQIREENYKQHLHRQELDIIKAKEKKDFEKTQRTNAVEDRNEKRQQFLDELTQKSLNERLWQLAKDTKYPATYYPTNLANLSEDQMRTLNMDLRLALRDKLQIKCKGPWAKFKRKLNASLQAQTE